MKRMLFALVAGALLSAPVATAPLAAQDPPRTSSTFPKPPPNYNPKPPRPPKPPENVNRPPKPPKPPKGPNQPR